jgi:curli production assembly/transport component CsgF
MIKSSSRSMHSRTGWAALPLAVVLACQPGLVNASELVYTPVNPSFGGSPLNGPVLLNSAQAQNKFKDPDSVDANKTPLQQFQDLLERSILSRLATAATSSVLGSSGQLVPGTVETGNFVITITDLGGGLLRVTTTDKVTGDSSIFEVGGGK